MPSEHIISRIKNIEARITEIQKLSGPSKKSIQKENSSQNNNQTNFSNILKEVMSARMDSDLNVMSDNTLKNTTPSSLADNKVDTLLKEYIKNGAMPSAQPKPYLSKQTNPETWDNIIKAASQEFNIDKELIHSVIKTESLYNPSAVSRAGAKGLMQLMPETAQDLGITDIFDPEQNIYGGTKYLRQMLDKYQGNLVKALAAYNAGPAAVDRNNGVPPYKETQEYIPKVLNDYYHLKQENR
ncbi:MAG: lytic transglycosylase domain-containing protein [Brevinemataceae bacterium]